MVKPYYDDGAGIVIYHGDCREILPSLESVDHVLTDPPYARDVYQRLKSPKTHKGTSIEKLASGSHRRD